jgi:cathepsin H
MLFLVALIAAVSALHYDLDQHPLVPSLDNFETWMKEFKIKFDTKLERTHRYNVWRSTVTEINTHNNGDHAWEQGLNQFSHWTWEEFNADRLMAPQKCSATSDEDKAHFEHLYPEFWDNLNQDPPASVDYRTQKIVSEVKEQGSCGSCWAFGTTGCLESLQAKQTGQLINFSEQQLVDCAKRLNNNGCKGGLTSQVFEYILYNKGINTEFVYSYEAKDKTCRFKTGAGKVSGHINDVYNITTYSAPDLLKSVGNAGPVAICFQVVSDFRSYKSGVYSSTKCKNLTSSVNHAVLAVGYGIATDSAKTPYYIVKNSWNWNWGNKGYFLIKKGVNMCGIAACSSYPILGQNP